MQTKLKPGDRVRYNDVGYFTGKNGTILSITGHNVSVRFDCSDVPTMIAPHSLSKISQGNEIEKDFKVGDRVEVISTKVCGYVNEILSETTRWPIKVRLDNKSIMSYGYYELQKVEPFIMETEIIEESSDTLSDGEKISKFNSLFKVGDRVCLQNNSGVYGIIEYIASTGMRVAFKNGNTKTTSWHLNGEVIKVELSLRELLILDSLENAKSEIKRMHNHFKVGDRVKYVGNVMISYLNKTGVIDSINSFDTLYKIKVRFFDIKEICACSYDELELCPKEDLEVGDKVRCIGQEHYHGKIGEIKEKCIIPTSVIVKFNDMEGSFVVNLNSLEKVYQEEEICNFKVGDRVRVNWLGAKNSIGVVTSVAGPKVSVLIKKQHKISKTVQVSYKWLTKIEKFIAGDKVEVMIDTPEIGEIVKDLGDGYYSIKFSSGKVELFSATILKRQEEEISEEKISNMWEGLSKTIQNGDEIVEGILRVVYTGDPAIFDENGHIRYIIQRRNGSSWISMKECAHLISKKVKVKGKKVWNSQYHPFPNTYSLRIDSLEDIVE